MASELRKIAPQALFAAKMEVQQVLNKYQMGGQPMPTAPQGMNAYLQPDASQFQPQGSEGSYHVLQPSQFWLTWFFAHCYLVESEWNLKYYA